MHRWTFCHQAAQDNSLDFYLQQAIANSPLTKDYQNQVASNGVDSLRIKAIYKPQANLAVNSSYSPIITHKEK